MPLPTISRLGLLLGPCFFVSLLAVPGQAANIWSQGDASSGPAVYAPPDALAAPARRVSQPAAVSPVPSVPAVAPDFNRWAGGPGVGARTGGFPFFCGNGLFSFGAGGPGGGRGDGFAFGLFN